MLIYIISSQNFFHSGLYFCKNFFNFGELMWNITYDWGKCINIEDHLMIFS
jgi:hypothetical protein